MNFGKKVAYTVTLALLSGGLVQCKPKKSGAASLKTITGTDEVSGKEVALALLPVRNFSLGKLDGKDPGAKQAAAMVRARLFALVECVSVVGSRGDRIDAATLMSAVEARAAIDDLYVDEFRNILTSKDDNKLAVYGSDANKLIKVPCQIHGRRLLSWDVLTDIQVRAAGLPKKGAADNEAAKEVYRLAQAMHLSLRGLYNKKRQDEFMPRVPSMMDMLYEQAGMAPNAGAVASRLRAADIVYNPCIEGVSKDKKVPDVSAFKWDSYGCAAHPSDDGMSVYRAGGGKGGDRYGAVKDRIALAIEGTHNVVFAKGDSDPALWDLWDILTSTKAYPTDGSARGRIGMYLTAGKGLEFDELFASDASSARPAAATSGKRINSTMIVAPLALGVTEGKRVQSISRATSETVDDARPLLEGGTRSSALKRAGTAKGRIDMLAKYMGADGKDGLAKLESQVNSAMSVLRKPAN